LKKKVIAGKDDFMVMTKESGAVFSFNFKEVYWNSRLSTEHARLIEIIRKTATNNATTPTTSSSSSSSTNQWIVADMMAGVGPFAVARAMYSGTCTLPAHPNKPNHNKHKKKQAKTITVSPVMAYANDLNPSSYQSLKKNIELNRCGHRIQPFNLDGRKFIEELVLQKRTLPQEVIMNLPAIAIEFLDCFIGLYRKYLNSYPSSSPSTYSEETIPLPRIHVYCFSSDPENPVKDAVQRVAQVLHCSSQSIEESRGFQGHIVRDVAPKKVMICISFQLPREVSGDCLFHFVFFARLLITTTSGGTEGK
jgi:tRNA (guanine37-N1)-methyltransferase